MVKLFFTHQLEIGSFVIPIEAIFNDHENLLAMRNLLSA